MYRSRLALVALFGSVAVMVGGCGDDDSGGSDVSGDDLDGRTFVAEEVEGFTLVDDTAITLTFTDDAVTVVAGCNTMGAGFEIDDGVLNVDEMASTLMACADELQEQDEWVASFLESGPNVALDGDVLTLTGDDATVTATELT